MTTWAERTAKMKTGQRQEYQDFISIYERLVNNVQALATQRTAGQTDKALVHENNLISAKIDRMWSRLNDQDREVILHEIVRHDWAPKLAISVLKLLNGKVVSVNAS